MTGHEAKRVYRVAVLEPLSLMRFGVKMVVDANDSLIWVGYGQSVTSTAEICRTDRPDALLIGSWTDPQWKLCQMFNGMFRDLAVIAIFGLSARNPKSLALARTHGARGLLSVEAEPSRLISAITTVVDHGYYVDPTLGIPTVATGPGSGGEDRPLSMREYEVLQLIAEGRTAEHIASRLGIAPDTVRTHVGHILRKMGARDRAHAVAKAFEMHLLGSAPRDLPCPAMLC